MSTRPTASAQGRSCRLVLWGDARALGPAMVGYRALGLPLLWAGSKPYPEIEHMPCADQGPAAALFGARRAYPHDWLLLAQAGVVLPRDAADRLRRVADQQKDAASVSALCNADPDLSPLPPGQACDENAVPQLDGLTFLIGPLSYFRHRHPLPQASLWRPNRPPSSISNELSWPALVEQQAQCHWVCDHLYVHSPRHALPGTANDRDSVALDIKRAPISAALATAGQPPPTPGLDHQPVQLHVLHSWGGGVTRWVQDMTHAQDDRHHLLLKSSGSFGARCYGRQLRLYSQDCLINEWTLQTPIASIEGSWPEYQAILQHIIERYCIDQVVVSSLIGHSLDALRCELPTMVVWHDYFPAWPLLQVSFEQDQGAFDQAHLERAFSQAGEHHFTDKSAAQWLALRRDYVAALKRPQLCIAAPDRSVITNLQRIDPAFGNLEVTVIPHGLRPFPRHRYRKTPHSSQRPLRLIVPGRIVAGKGQALLMQLLKQHALADSVELYLLGAGADGHRFFGLQGVHVVLDYQRDHLPQLLTHIQPDAALLLSTVSETFSYTLSEMWALGIPVIASAVGALAQRITDGENGFLVVPTATAVIERLKQLSSQPDRIDAVAAQLAQHKPPTLVNMGQAYQALCPPVAVKPLRYRLSPPSLQHMALAVLERERYRLRRELDQAQAQAQRDQTELGRRADWGHDLERQLAQRSDWAKQLQADLASAQQHLDQLRQEFDQRSAWALQLQHELEQAQQAMQQLNRVAADYRRVIASRSWRLTRPLRGLARLLRAARRRSISTSRRALSLARRTRNSLRVRGLAGTIKRIGQGLQRQRPAHNRAQTKLPTRYGPLHFASHEQVAVSIIIPVFNNFQHTYACLASLGKHSSDQPTCQIIVVDDASSDETQKQLKRSSGIDYIRNPRNLGFIGSCNRGAEVARGQYLVFLNNDTLVHDGWLNALHQTFNHYPKAGLVGAKLVYPDGRLQEAGGIVFADGSGWNYGRFEHPDHPAYNFVRAVDYCSGACIMLPRDLFEALGGFDRRYTPAYYEDTDLAFAVRQAGRQVYYQPAARITHFEGVSSGTDTNSGIKRYQVVNQHKFAEKWAQALARQPAPGGDIEHAALRGYQHRALIIDACTPTPDQDSGSLRMTNLMQLLQQLGYQVSFMADNRAYVSGYTERLQQRGITVYHAPFVDSPAKLLTRIGAPLDLVILSRHYVAQHYTDLVRQYCPRARLLFDTVDLHYLREQRLASLRDDHKLAATARQTQQAELAVARACDLTLVVSPHEQQVLATDAPDLKVAVLSNIHAVHGCRKTFDQRQGLFFVGGFQHPPNVDAVTWFVQEVFPLVRAQLRQVQVHIVGSNAPSSIRQLHGDGVVIEGYVKDIEPYLDGCRVALAPLRYGAGVKGKVNMSMSYGQPVVATSPAIEGMHVTAGQEVLVGDTPKAFADAVLEVYNNETLWNRISANGLANVEQHFSFAAAATALSQILAEAAPSRPDLSLGH